MKITIESSTPQPKIEIPAPIASDKSKGEGRKDDSKGEGKKERAEKK
jgi:hypothetical protein